MLRNRAVRDRTRYLVVAERYYRDALDVDPSYALARIRLGRVQCLENLLPRARASLDAGRAASTEPRPRFLAALFMGGLELQQGDLEGARRAYQEALAIMPQSQNAIAGLAYTELVAGHVERAEQIARQYTGATLDDAWWAYKAGALDLEGLQWLRQRVHR